MVPKKVFFTKGVGIHKERLASEELALRNAGVAHLNLHYVSGIYPPGCRRISKEEGLKLLLPGDVTDAYFIQESTNEPNRLVVASLGVAIPSDPEQYGIMFVYRDFGVTDDRAGDYVEDLSARRLADSLGIEFDLELDWNELEQFFKVSGKIVRTSNITQSAVGNKDGLWTTVFAAAIFVSDP